MVRAYYVYDFRDNDWLASEPTMGRMVWTSNRDNAHRFTDPMKALEWTFYAREMNGGSPTRFAVVPA